jgi:hypothetical protein
VLSIFTAFRHGDLGIETSRISRLTDLAIAKHGEAISGAVSSPARRDHDQAIGCQFPVGVVNRPGGYGVVIGELTHRGKLLAGLPLVGVKPASQIVKYPDARTFSRSAHGPRIIV